MLPIVGGSSRFHPGLPGHGFVELGDAALALAMLSHEAASGVAARFDWSQARAEGARMVEVVTDHARLSYDLNVRLAAALLDIAGPAIRPGQEGLGSGGIGPPG